MAHEETLAERLRDLLAGEEGIAEKQMFGGVGFLLDGNLAISASGQGGLLVRIDPADGADLVAREHVEPMVMRGREMAGWIRVDPEGARTKRQLEAWLRRGLDFAATLPPKLKAGSYRGSRIVKPLD